MHSGRVTWDNARARRAAAPSARVAPPAVVCTALNGLCVIVTSLDVLSPASSSSSSSKAWRDPG